MQNRNHRRYFPRRKTLMALFPFMCGVIPILISCIGTWQRQRSWMAQLGSPAEDLNIAAAQAIADGYCGISYLSDLMFTDMAEILTLFLVIGFGIRAVYDSRNRAKWVSDQSILWGGAISCTGLLTVITLLFMLFYPSRRVRPITMDLYGLRYAGDLKILLILLLQIGIITVVVTLCTAVVQISIPLFRHPYLAVGMPLILYFGMHLLVGITGDIHPVVRAIMEPALLSSSISALYTLFSATTSLGAAVIQFVGFPLIAALFYVLIAKAQKKEYRG